MANYRKLARRDARRYGIDPNVFGRQINLESGYNPNAVSPAGAIGIAQFMPGTARSEGVNPRDPRSALLGAARLDAKLIKQTGSYRKALAAYNAGPGNIPAGLGYADKILGGRMPQGGAPSAPQTPAPSAYGADSRQQIALSLLGLGGLAGGSYGGGGDPLTSALLQATQQGGKGPAIPHGPQPTGSDITAIASRANQINRERLPYQWGGGHGAAPAGPGVPLDCSGAVSRLLNVSPRVSGDYTKFGQSGPGKSLTIYANGHHVLMEINGHFWGTSGTNPGGGAGWIPRSAISPGYLKGFVARHPAGM